MFYYPGFWLFILPAIILGFIAQAAVRSKFNKYSQVRTYRGLTGAEVARQILDTNGLYDVSVEETQGFLSDHYDPRSRTLRLSPDVARAPSVAAVGVAAHEAGHALQHATGYTPLQLRSFMVPAVQLGTWLGPFVIISGIFLEIFFRLSGLGLAIAWFGVALYALVALFSLVTLPVELDASSRAKKMLYQYNIVDKQELSGVNSVLSAAAWTYVVAAIAALLQLARWILILLGRRD
ncbi:MAG: zinc metallopeptidase [Anaerolineae bacterium]|jgi:Zn-dependent membrane protease YugP|nr:zinc metallopeptidase [Anaerolineae bacterium]